MRKIAKHALRGVVVWVGLMAAPAMAASGNQSSQGGSSQAQVVKPIRITHGNLDGSAATLNFGKFTAVGSGSVTVQTSGFAYTGGSVNHVPGSSTSVDSFVITGEPSRLFGILVSSGSVSNGSRQMNFTPQVQFGSAVLDSAGVKQLKVGGVLSVPSNMPVGVYSGSYVVRATYQ
ncbi:DUF4402 domain-containing protein [Novosphingobium sp. FSY-8]|uniref:DUF4402 domain-containing protein n=1 Tax=Novosphingobium ovatum TaxID=1908523 RepID=A0ABW9XA03_9SPHN|nr:DUF4402 domain-containing protein [Novosphingobium ovatum]NBC35365.1 DUF4402 domain-containing protein [Novosphingobium ovatum]